MNNIAGPHSLRKNGKWTTSHRLKLDNHFLYTVAIRVYVSLVKAVMISAYNDVL